MPYWAGRAHSPNIARRQSSQSSASVRPFATTSRHMIIVSRRKYTVRLAQSTRHHRLITVSSPSRLVARRRRTHTYTRAHVHVHSNTRTPHLASSRLAHTYSSKYNGKQPVILYLCAWATCPLFHRHRLAPSAHRSLPPAPPPPPHRSRRPSPYTARSRIHALAPVIVVAAARRFSCCLSVSVCQCRESSVLFNTLFYICSGGV